MPISLRFPIALILSIVCLATPAWADFQAGMKAFERADYETALREWRPLAERGDADFVVGFITYPCVFEWSPEFPGILVDP